MSEELTPTEDNRTKWVKDRPIKYRVFDNDHENDLPIIDPNYEYKYQIEQTIDELSIFEREIFSLRHGILEYETQGTRTFRNIASLLRKPEATIRYNYKKIVYKIRHPHHQKRPN